MTERLNYTIQKAKDEAFRVARINKRYLRSCSCNFEEIDGIELRLHKDSCFIADYSTMYSTKKIRDLISDEQKETPYRWTIFPSTIKGKL